MIRVLKVQRAKQAHPELPDLLAPLVFLVRLDVPGRPDLLAPPARKARPLGEAK